MRRHKHRGKVAELLKRMDKGRKKSWMPRGEEAIPPSRAHNPKKGAYNRKKEKDISRFLEGDHE